MSCWRGPTLLAVCSALLFSQTAECAPDTPEQVQIREAQASLYRGSIKTSLAMFKVLDQEGADAAIEQDTIRQDVAMFEKGADIYKQTVEAAKVNREKLDREIAAYEQRRASSDALVDNWNGRCGRVFGPRETGAYQQCLQEQAALQPAIDQNRKDRADLKISTDRQIEEEQKLHQQGLDLDEIRQKLIMRVENNERRGLEYLAKRKRLLEQIDDFRERLEKLQTAFDLCVHMARSDKETQKVKKEDIPAETVHEVCGRAFDGNRVQDTYLPGYSRLPKWSPWGSK